VFFLWRYTHVENIDFFSAEAFGYYLQFVVINYLFILLVFFVLFLLGGRNRREG
jgi:hypothetical protein